MKVTEQEGIMDSYTSDKTDQVANKVLSVMNKIS